jgi:CheY-like chemotaxis protein
MNLADVRPEVTPAGIRPEGRLSAADTLHELTFAGAGAQELAKRVWLSDAVAIVLRASIDWLVGPRAVLRLSAQDSVLELGFDGVELDGIEAASRALGSVQGNAGPVRDGHPLGPWRVRVPTLASRPCYLMVVRDGTPIAIPWHAVLRFAMASRDDFDRLRSNEEAPLIDGTPATPRTSTHAPIILVAHGRKRAWIEVDRLVWRFNADDHRSSSAPPSPEFSREVRTSAGDVYWVADPAGMLRDVEAPPPPRRVVAEMPPESLPPEHTESEMAVVDEPSATELLATETMPSAAEIAIMDALPESPEIGTAVEAVVAAIDVEGMVDTLPKADGAPSIETPEFPADVMDAAPLETPAMDVVAIDSDDPSSDLELTSLDVEPIEEAPADDLPWSSPGEEAAPWTALIAEDSITARIFLERMLEQRGFAVRAVETAAALRQAFEERAWALVCVDVELPDARGGAFLASLAADPAQGPVLVALVRDDEDVEVARRAGISRTLRKPYDPEALSDMLARAGLATERAR